MDVIAHAADLERLGRAWQAFAVLLAWDRAGLLDALDDGRPRDAADIGMDPRALAVTGPILASLGVLSRHERDGGEAWSLSATARELRRSGGLRLALYQQRADVFAALPDALRRGGPVLPDTDRFRGGVASDDPHAAKQFLDMLYARSALPAETTADAVARRLRGGRALDLGGGHGRYAVALADRGFSVTLYDQANGVAVARERHGDRLAYVAGDFMTDDLGGPWDVILASNIVHSLSEADGRALVARLVAATAPGGLIVLKDLFLHDSADGPDAAALFGLVMFAMTRGGRSYRAGEAMAWLRGAGCVAVERDDHPDQQFALVIGRR